MRDPGCVFCTIVAGEEEAERVLEDDDFVAFLDQRPVFKGHTLLVPREHFVTLPDLPACSATPSWRRRSGSPPRLWTGWVRRAASSR